MSFCYTNFSSHDGNENRLRFAPARKHKHLLLQNNTAGGEGFIRGKANKTLFLGGVSFVTFIAAAGKKR